MAFLSKEKAAALVALYRDDDVATLADVAEAAGVSAKTARHYIEQAGVEVRDGEDGAAEVAADAPIPAVADVTRSPEFKAAVAAAVAEAFALMSPASAPADAGVMGEFMNTFKQFAQSLHQQQAGYSKPLDPEEVASRAAGEAEFFDLIEAAQDAVENFGRKGARDRDLVPYYIVGPGGFYIRTENGEELFSPGQPTYTTVPPPIDFEPLNEAGALIMIAQRKWLGEEPADLGEMLAAAQMRLLGRDPEEPDRQNSRRTRQIAEADSGAPIAKVGARQMMGTTISTEADGGRGSFQVTKGHVARPVSGPVFADN